MQNQFLRDIDIDLNLITNLENYLKVMVYLYQEHQ